MTETDRQTNRQTDTHTNTDTQKNRDRDRESRSSLIFKPVTPTQLKAIPVHVRANNFDDSLFTMSMSPADETTPSRNSM